MTAKAKTYFAAAVAVGVLLLFAAYPLLKESQTLLAWLAIIATVAVLVLAVPSKIGRSFYQATLAAWRKLVNGGNN